MFNRSNVKINVFMNFLKHFLVWTFNGWTKIMREYKKKKKMGK